MSPQPPPSDWIVPPAPFSGHINLVEYDPTWPAQYEAVAGRIRTAIGKTAIILEHAGSTSVPGLAAPARNREQSPSGNGDPDPLT